VDGVAEPVILFAVVFALNIIPVFAPPTWMALSRVGFTHPLGNPFVVALIGALAATSGRLVLARLARAVIRQRFMGERMRANIDVLKDGLARHRTLTFSVFLAYAFSPFPSNYLFIAYGLTSLPLRLVAVPFFLGRCASYSFFVFTASEVSQHLAHEATEAQPYLGVYFVVLQLALLGLVIVLARIDWQHAATVKRLRWLRPAKLDRS
jgi:membrane protein DedA with SNARE-associated domain